MEPSGIKGYFLCPDVGFLIKKQGVLASNYRAKRHVWLNLDLFNLLVDGQNNGALVGADVTTFSNLEGLLADPSCLGSFEDIDEVSFEDVNEAANYLHERLILIKDLETYRTHFQKKTSILDREHIGTFHQQLGVELHLKERVNPDEWWYDQKFDRPDGSVKRNLYKYVQEAFYDSYFESSNLSGKTILDFGCGNGITSRRFIESGAKVIGVDPNSLFLEEARSRLGDLFTPILLDLEDSDPLSRLGSVPIDLVWMSDVLLFYFYPQVDSNKTPSPAELLKMVTKNLQIGGKCVVMQPHGVFWLTPWMGNDDNPYTVVTEYSERLYSVTPSLEELCSSFKDSGLAITAVFEPKPNACEDDLDIKASSFAKSFPLWWVFECVKL